MRSAHLRDALTLGPWRRRREMRRLLRELDRLDAGAAVRRADHPPRRHRLTALLVAAGLAAVIGGTTAHKVLGLGWVDGELRFASRLADPPVVDPGGTYAFLYVQPHDTARPAAYDPCRPIEYVVNDAAQPDGAGPLVAAAIDAVAAATGLVFVEVGSSDEVPVDEPSMLSPRRKPALIAWTTPELVPGLAGRVAGLAGSAARPYELTGEVELVNGTVALDAPQLTEVLHRPDGAQQVRAIVMHELGHLVGLAHVDDPAELMFDDNLGVTDFGRGDRTGLAALGAGRCFH